MDSVSWTPGWTPTTTCGRVPRIQDYLVRDLDRKTSHPPIVIPSATMLFAPHIWKSKK